MRKKKLTINSLAMGNLKQRRKQYAIMIVGIILAMVFSSAIPFYLFGSYETELEKNRGKVGGQDSIVCAYGEGEDFYENAVKEGAISQYGLAHIIGFGYTEESGEDSGASIAWLDDKAQELSYQSFIDGGYPQNENEIAIEQSVLKKLGIEPKIGEVITLAVKTQNAEDYLDVKVKTFTLVGVVSDKNTVLGGEFGGFVPAAFVAQGTQTEVGGKELLSAYVSAGGGDNAFSKIYEYFHSVSDNVRICGVNVYMLSLTTTGLYNAGKFIVLLSIALIFAACAAIVNSFNSNLNERKSQIGMLRAVGATKRQIIKVFGREAFFISLICTPISLAISYGLVLLLLTLIHGEAVMTKSISVLLLCAGICVAVTMLAASIPLISAARITPMQAIRNIEINRKMRIKRIKSKKQFDVSTHLAKRNAQFYKGKTVAVSIMLAVTIVISCLGFSSVGFSKSNIRTSDFDYKVYSEKIYDYIGNFQIANYGVAGISEADKREFDDYPYFSKVISQKFVSAVIEVSEITDYYLCMQPTRNPFDISRYGDDNIREDELTNDNFMNSMIDIENMNYLESKKNFGFSGDFVTSRIYSFDESTLRALEDSLTAGKIDYEKLASGEEIILVAPQSVKNTVTIIDGSFYNYYENPVYDNEPIPDDYSAVCAGDSPYSVGDKINVSVIEYQDPDDYYAMNDHFSKVSKEVTIGAIVSPANLSDDIGKLVEEGFAMLTTHSGMNAFSERAGYVQLLMDVDEKIEIDDAFEDTVAGFCKSFTDKYDEVGLDSNYAELKAQKEGLQTSLLSLLSIIIVGFIVCASIVNNAVSASIRERKREIGTLRAVGANRSVLVKSYVLQLIPMLTFGCSTGFIIYCAVYAVKLIQSQIWNYVFQKNTFYYVFSPWETLAFCAILFAICSINLWSKVRKEMKNSIVENIKEL